MVARLRAFLLGLTLLANVASAATFNLFSPATGILKGSSSTYVTNAAVSLDVRTLWSGTCDNTTYLRGDGTCATPPSGSGTVTSVALTVPSGFSITGSPITTSGTLAISGTLNPAAGGTGVATLSGIAKGNGTSAFTAALSSDIYGLWSGTCSSTTFLRGDGSCATPTAGSGTVTSVALTAPAIFSVSGSPVTTSGTLAISAAGTSGGVPYFNSSTTLASSGALTANAITLGGGAGAAPTSLGSLGTTTTLLHGNAAGAPSFSAVSLTADITGTLGAGNGGTGQSTYAIGDILYASASTTLTKLPDVAAGSYLRSGGVTTAPLWSTTTLPNSATTGDLMYASGTNAYTNLADVATGSYLKSGGVGVAPSYATVASLGADPTGTIGLTAVNGSASTFTRSDAAPALSQSISPTWTGDHVFNIPGSTPLQIRANASGAISLAIDNNSTYNTLMALRNSNIDKGYIGIVGTASGLCGTGAATGDMCIRADGGSFRISTNSGISSAFGITTGGNVSVNAPSSGTALTINATSGSTAALNVASGTVQVAGSAGTSGQVLTSQGSSSPPIWTNSAGITGSFTATLTGFGTNPTGTISYRVTGNVASLWVASGITDTSNANTMTITGLPSAIQPASVHCVPSYMKDNSLSGLSGLACAGQGGASVITMQESHTAGTQIQSSAANFTASGIKGIDSGWTITYPLD